MEGRGASSREAEAMFASKELLFFLSLFHSHFLLGVEEGRGAKLYSNCAGEVTMIAFYCPLSPQVSGIVYPYGVVGESGGGGQSMQRRRPLL